MIEKDHLTKALHIPLKSAGFKKKSSSWYLDGQDTIVVVNLQRSNWSRCYYVNIGIWLKALLEVTFPKHYQCHIDLRLDELFPSDSGLIATACDLEKSDLSQLHNLTVLFETRVLPFLFECGQEDQLKAQIQSSLVLAPKMLRRVEARYYLLGADRPVS